MLLTLHVSIEAIKRKEIDKTVPKYWIMLKFIDGNFSQRR